MNVINVYFDTEFTSLEDPRLISIGFSAAGQGKNNDFYAELLDTYNKSMCSTFVLDTVLPLLDNTNQIRLKDLKTKLKDWMESLTVSDPSAMVQLWADVPHFDWPFIEMIFNDGMPSNLIGACCCTLDIDDKQREIYDSVHDAYWNVNFALGAEQHHALWDARCIREAHTRCLN